MSLGSGIAYLLLIIVSFLLNAYWCLSALFPKAPRINVFFLIPRTFIGVGFIIAALYNMFILFALVVSF